MTGETTTPSDLTPEEAAELEEYLAGRLSPERRAALEQRILASERLADALYADVSLRSSFEESRGDAVAPRRARVIPLFASRWTRIALPLAAGLALLVLSPRLFGPRHAEDDSGFDGTPHFRSGTLEPALRALAPTGDVAGEPTFTWTRDPSADAYRLELLGASGEVVFSTTTPDTTLAVPRASLRDPRGVTAWRVVPRRAGKDAAPSATSPLRLLPR
ncbi:MAG: hypothetical protein U0167_08280 [bacterium]